jgi:hypothetical protein
MSHGPAPSGISESQRRRLAAARRANVVARNRPPGIVSAEHQEVAAKILAKCVVEKAPVKCRAQDIVVTEQRARCKPLPSPRSAPKAEPAEFRDDSHGERNPRAWISLTTGQTGVGTPGRNGTLHPESYIWKPTIG